MLRSTWAVMTTSLIEWDFRVSSSWTGGEDLLKLGKVACDRVALPLLVPRCSQAWLVGQIQFCFQIWPACWGRLPGPTSSSKSGDDGSAFSCHISFLREARVLHIMYIYICIHTYIYIIYVYIYIYIYIYIIYVYLYIYIFKIYIYIYAQIRWNRRCLKSHPGSSGWESRSVGQILLQSWTLINRSIGRWDNMRLSCNGMTGKELQHNALWYLWKLKN